MTPLPWNQAFHRHSDSTTVADLYDVLLASSTSSKSTTFSSLTSSTAVTSSMTPSSAVSSTTSVLASTATIFPSPSPTAAAQDSSSSKNGVIAIATAIPAFCIVLIVALCVFLRRQRQYRSESRQLSPRSASTSEFKATPTTPTMDRMQYPPIHDQHTKPLPAPSPPQTSKPKASPNRFTLLSSVSIGSGIPSFKSFGRKPSISTFASASSPNLPDLPITADEPLTSATFEDEEHNPSVLDHDVREPLSRRSTTRTLRSQMSTSELGTDPSALLAQSGIRMSRFFPFLRIDPAATGMTRSASPVPSSSASTRHMSVLPPYHSPSVYNYAVPFDKLATPSVVTPDTMSLVSHRASVISAQSPPSDTSERKKHPRSLALLNRLPQRKTTLFGPRSPSSLRVMSSPQSMAPPLSLTQEAATLFPSPSSEDDPSQQVPPSPSSPRSNKPSAGSGSRPAGSTAASSATVPQSTPDREGSPPVSPRRPLPFVPQEPSSPPPSTSKTKKRRSLISRLSWSGRSSSASSRLRSVEQELSSSSSADIPPVPSLPLLITAATESSQQQQQQQQRFLPITPVHSDRIPSREPSLPSSRNTESKVRETPSLRRKLPDPAGVTAAALSPSPVVSAGQTQTATISSDGGSKHTRPPLPLPPIPNAEDPVS